MILDIIEAHIEKQCVIIVESMLPESGIDSWGYIPILRHKTMQEKIFKVFIFTVFSGTGYEANMVQLNALKRYTKGIVIITNIEGSRGCDYKCGIPSHVIMAFNPDNHCTVT